MSVINSLSPCITCDDELDEDKKFALDSTLDELKIESIPTNESSLFEIIQFNDRYGDNLKLKRMLNDCGSYGEMLKRYGGADGVIAQLQAIDKLEEVTSKSSNNIKDALISHRF